MRPFEVETMHSLSLQFQKFNLNHNIDLKFLTKFIEMF